MTARPLPEPSVVSRFQRRGMGGVPFESFRGFYDRDGRVVRLFEPGERVPLRWRRLFWWRYTRKGLAVPTVEDARANPYRPKLNRSVRRGRTALR